MQFSLNYGLVLLCRLNRSCLPNARKKVEIDPVDFGREGNKINRGITTMLFHRKMTRRLVLSAAAGLSLLASVSVASAEAVKVAAIYTLPVEQQWISRIHKALNAANERGDIEYVFSENVANTDYERVMREYAEQGNQLIVGEVFGL